MDSRVALIGIMVEKENSVEELNNCFTNTAVISWAAWGFRIIRGE